MKLGDVIVAIAGRPGDRHQPTLNAIADTAARQVRAGARAARHDQEMQLDVMVGKRKPRPPPGRSPSRRCGR